MIRRVFELDDLLVLHVSLNTGLATSVLAWHEHTVRLSATTNQTKLVFINFYFRLGLLSYLVSFENHILELLDED